MSFSENRNKCFDMAKECTENNYDIYSYIASKIFNVPIEECKEFDSDMNINPDGIQRRNIAKRIALNTQSVYSLTKIANIPDLPKMVEQAFPFVFDEEDTEHQDSDLDQSTTFIVQLVGYVRMVRWMREFEFRQEE